MQIQVLGRLASLKRGGAGGGNPTHTPCETEIESDNGVLDARRTWLRCPLGGSPAKLHQRCAGKPNPAEEPKQGAGSGGIAACRAAPKFDANVCRFVNDRCDRVSPRPSRPLPQLRRPRRVLEPTPIRSFP